MRTRGKRRQLRCRPTWRSRRLHNGKNDNLCRTKPSTPFIHCYWRHSIRRHSMSITASRQSPDNDARCARETFPMRYRPRTSSLKHVRAKRDSCRKFVTARLFCAFRPAGSYAAGVVTPVRAIHGYMRETEVRAQRGSAARCSLASACGNPGTPLECRPDSADRTSRDEATRDAIAMNRAAAMCRAIPSCADARRRASAARRTAGCIRG